MCSTVKRIKKEFHRIDDNFKKATGGMDRFLGNVLTGGAADVFYFQPKEAMEAQQEAQQQALADARKQADQAFNKANPKAPDVSGLLRRNRRAGAPATMLTGPGGVSSYNLGSTSLLG